MPLQLAQGLFVSVPSSWHVTWPFLFLACREKEVSLCVYKADGSEGCDSDAVWLWLAFDLNQQAILHWQGPEREMTRGSEDKRTESWCQEVLYKLCLIPSKLIEKDSILYTVCWKAMGQSQQKAIIQLDNVNSKPIKQFCTKGTQVSQEDPLVLELIAIAP